MKAALFSLLPALIIPVAAHGWVGSIAIAGQTYQGNGLGTSGFASVIRQVDTNSPVTSVSDPNLACGPNAQLAEDVAAANPGDAMDINWVSTAGAWFHNVGPMLTYMASCGSAPCSGFDPSQAMWFKIQQSGRDATGWVQALLNSGAPANFSLPSNLAPGNYLLRHEIIALQNAVSEGGAEFYASCSQLSVGGSGSGAPTSSELVKLPGAYSATDPGILVDVYTNPDAPYTFPGPPIAAFVSGSSSAPPAEPSGSLSPSQTLPAGTSAISAAPSASSTSCKLRRNVLTDGSSSIPSPSRKRWHRSLRNFSIFQK
ncbi:glycosyl hydrolase family 61-domain-containing protein [Mycena maculata]|uniref:lytic cellulose monooxygenase (C4-dehydrogenating) n=1 Tax=Mycena maculata TaxID=230809 RepID=A0AAD7KD27_9AGAR|nr:glycosyl hydrolase family 61-domain-containing protein [Mycena maculata]